MKTTKDEKEVLEHFAGVFTMASMLTFKEIFSSTIEVLSNRTASRNIDL